MNDQLRVRMDRGAEHSLVHGERGPDDRHSATAYYQNGLPFDAEGFLILDHADFENHRGQNCSRKAAELRTKAHVLMRQEEKRQKKLKERDKRDQQQQRGPARSAIKLDPSREIVSDAPPPLVGAVTTTETRIGPPPEQTAPPAAETDETETETEVDDDGEAEGDEAEGDEESGDDEGDDEPAQPNIEQWLRGNEDVQWHVMTQILAGRYKRRFSKIEDALDFLVLDKEGPHVVSPGELSSRFRAKLN